MQIAPGPASGEAAAPARTPWWRRGVRNGVVMGLLALAAILLLSQGELPGLGRVLAELPAGVAISAAVHLPQIVLTAMAWRFLLPPGTRPSMAAMTQLRWYRESANALLPAGALVGTVSEGGAGPDGSYVAYLGVLESARGRGVATGLLRTIIADAASRGRDRVGLEVDADSPTGADGLYTSMGWGTKYVTESWHKDVTVT